MAWFQLEPGHNYSWSASAASCNAGWGDNNGGMEFLSTPLPGPRIGCGLRVGLSGGIGSGKSTLTAELRAAGITVLDADEISRELTAAGTETLARIALRFGQEVIDAEGELDRAALAAIVFQNDQARRDLEALTHPKIRAEAQKWLQATPRGEVRVYDVPLLVEAGWTGDVDLVVMVDAPVDIRVQRLVENRGMNRQQAQARIQAQASRASRRQAAHIWISNTGELTQLQQEARQLAALLRQLVANQSNLYP